MVQWLTYMTPLEFKLEARPVKRQELRDSILFIKWQQLSPVCQGSTQCWGCLHGGQKWQHPRVAIVTLNIYNRREERPKINHQASILRKFKKRNNINLKNRNRRNSKIRTEISKIENKKSIEKMMKS